MTPQEQKLTDEELSAINMFLVMVSYRFGHMTKEVFFEWIDGLIKEMRVIEEMDDIINELKRGLN